MDLFEGTPGGKVNIAELGKGKKILIFGVPGAFTPGCSKVRIPFTKWNDFFDLIYEYLKVIVNFFRPIFQDMSMLRIRSKGRE